MSTQPEGRIGFVSPYGDHYVLGTWNELNQLER